MNLIKSILENWQQLESHPIFKEIEGHWQQAYTSRYSMSLFVFIMVWVILSSFFWSYQRIKDSSHLSSFQYTVKNTPLVAREPLQLGSKRLMGTPPAQAAIAEHVVIQAILFDQQPQNREVLLTDESGQVKSYKIGDHLPGGSQIIAIEPQSIVIERYGMKQTFRMNQYPSNFISNQPLQQTNSILQ